MAQVSIPTTASDALHLSAFVSFFVVAAIFSPCNSAYVFAKLQPRLARGVEARFARDSLARPVVFTAWWILLLLANLALEYPLLPVAFSLVSGTGRSERCAAGAKDSLETIDVARLAGMMLLIALVPLLIWEAVVGCALIQGETPQKGKIASSNWQLWAVMATGGLFGFLLTLGVDYARS